MFQENSRVANQTVKKCVCGKDTDPYKGNCVGCKNPPGQCACRPHSPIGKLTRAQLTSKFTERYGKKYSTESIIQFAEDKNFITNIGGGEYLSHFNLNSLYEQLEQESDHLIEQRKIVANIFHQDKKPTLAEAMYETHKSIFGEQESQPSRVGGLTSSELRAIPSYQYCLHPQVRQAILETTNEIEQLKQHSLVSQATVNSWMSKLSQVRSDYQADQVLRQIRAYTSGFQVTANEMNTNAKIHEIRQMDSINELRKLMTDSNGKIRIEVARRLGDLNAKDLLVSMINREGESEPVQKIIVEILGQKEDINSLRGLLDHSSAYVRARAIQKLEEVESEYN